MLNDSAPFADDPDDDSQFPHSERCRHCGGSGGSTGHSRYCVLRP